MFLLIFTDSLKHQAASTGRRAGGAGCITVSPSSTVFKPRQEWRGPGWPGAASALGHLGKAHSSLIFVNFYERRLEVHAIIRKIQLFKANSSSLSYFTGRRVFLEYS